MHTEINSKSLIRLKIRLAFAFVVFVAILYGLTDYCLPLEIVKKKTLKYMGKYTHATDWSLLGVGTIVFFYITHNILKLTINPTTLVLLEVIIKFGLTILIPIQIYITAAFTYITLRQPVNFNEPCFEKKDLRTSILTKFIQHYVPIIGLTLVNIEYNCITTRSSHIVTVLCISLYYLITLIAYRYNKKWHYPFMRHLSHFQVSALYGFSIVLVLCISELLRYVSIARDRRLMKLKKNRKHID